MHGLHSIGVEDATIAAKYLPWVCIIYNVLSRLLIQSQQFPPCHNFRSFRKH